MAETKYGKYLIEPKFLIFREGENPLLEFSAGPYGIEATWVIMSTTKVMDEETRLRLRENAHTHTHHQFITMFGANPHDIGEFDAESWNALGEELEDQLIDKPSVMNIPAGLKHGAGSRPGRMGKPTFHLDLSFAAEYQRTEFDYVKEKTPEELAALAAKGARGENKYGQYVIPATINPAKDGQNPVLDFKAMPYGVDASWTIMSMTKEMDEEVQKKIFEKPHYHNHEQFITFWGSNPHNIEEFDAEISICLGEEREEHIIDRPMVIHLPAGMVHGFGKTPHRIGAPVFHLDLNFGKEYQRTDLPED